MRPAVLSRIAATAVVAAAAVTASIAAPASAATPVSAAMLASAATSAQSGLAGVWCATAANCLAVGVSEANPNNSATGRPLAQTWNGKSWRTVSVRLPAGSTFGGLERLACVSARWCVAVGDYGKGSTAHVLAEFWNGRTWTPSEPPAPAGSAGDTLLIGVSCVSARSCVAVGSYDTSGNTVAVIEKWNGAKWARTNPPLPRSAGDFSVLESVSCPSAKFCLAAGTSFAGPLAESWNGTAWRRISAPSSPSADLTDLVGVSCVSPASCVAVGAVIGPSSVVSFSGTWNGKSWATAKVPWPKGTANSLLSAVSCVSRTYCVAAGNVGENLSSVVNAGRAAAARWNGKTWTVQPVPAPARGKATFFLGVSCLLATSCAAVGFVGPVHSAASTSLSGFWNGKSWKLFPAI